MAARGGRASAGTDLQDRLSRGARRSGVGFELRFAEGDESRLPALASELVALNVDVIVTSGPALFAPRQATSTIPIVTASGGDLVGLGLVSSLAHPGGNITGLTFFIAELFAKRLEMLEQIAPSLARAGLLLLRTKLG